MTWWQQLLVTIGAGTVTAAGAFLGVWASGNHRERMAREAREAEQKDRARERAEARRDRHRQQRTDAYRAYLRWLAQMPVNTELQVTKEGKPPDAEEVRNRSRDSRVVLADLLLYGSDAVKEKAMQVQAANSECGNRSTREFIVLQKQMAARPEPGDPKIDVLLFNTIFPRHFYELVWLVAEKLAEAMSGELSAMGDGASPD